MATGAIELGQSRAATWPRGNRALPPGPEATARCHLARSVELSKKLENSVECNKQRSGGVVVLEPHEVLVSGSDSPTDPLFWRFFFGRQNIKKFGRAALIRTAADLIHTEKPFRCAMRVSSFSQQFEMYLYK